MAQYTQARSVVANMDRKQSGNLLARPLSNVLVGLELPHSSEYIETVYVAMPRRLETDWLNSYETLAPMVVPRSAVLLASDSETFLYGVNVFRKTAAEFKTKAREAKFTPRELVGEPSDAQAEQQQHAELVRQLSDQAHHLLRIAKSHFGDVFSALVHLKFIKTFVESVLLYGLPPIYLVLLVKPLKEDKKLQTTLNKAILDLRLPEITASSHRHPSTSSIPDVKGGGDKSNLGSEEYLPYVQMSLSCTLPHL